MTVKEAAAFLAVKPGRIYDLVASNRLKSHRGESMTPGFPGPIIIDSTEEELRAIHTSGKPYNPRSPRVNGQVVSSAHGSNVRFLSLPKIGKMLGVSSGAIRQRIVKRGLQGKCINGDAGLMFPENLLPRIEERKRASKGQGTKTPKATASSDTGIQSRLTGIDVRLQRIEESLERLVKAWS